jgi:adenylosuccinate synthase
MKTSIVLGLGFGDEGKGMTTDFLCRQSRHSLVIRFSGGHQAGHTVVTENNQRHVFSSIGSGTFQGVPTYWSRFCTFYPSGFRKEWQVLQQQNIQPKVFVDALCPVTTPYDVFYNQLTERSNRHGSCGVGFGATQSRSLSPYKLYAQDLAFPQVLKQKLKAIAHYYELLGQGVFSADSLSRQVAEFKKDVSAVLPIIELVQEGKFMRMLDYQAVIFEGSQGILLDMDHGFFPNVTYAHTTSRNAMELIQRYQLPLPEIYYITRAYQTRHGHGFLSNEERRPGFTPNPRETNQPNAWQGQQRVGMLDLDMLEYALQSDENYSPHVDKHLVVTCMDQLTGLLQATRSGKPIIFPSVRELAATLPCINGQVLESYSECGAHLGHDASQAAAKEGMAIYTDAPAKVP